MREAVFVFLFSSVLLFSCQQPDVKTAKSYYNFDSLITRQVVLLGKAGEKWKKISLLNGKSDSVSFQPDTTAWKNELDVFRQLDVINKGLYRGYYRIVEKKDTHSNLMVRSFQFRSDNPEKLESPVAYVDFYYFNRFEDLRKIKSAYKERNLLFSSGREFTMEFTEGQKKNLVGYEIRGFQKMILADSVLMDVKGAVAN
jgi:hypothetical protein